ncbi:MAG: hypothetical protein ACOZAN_04865 [Patescibacteria group bacterium]
MPNPNETARKPIDRKQFLQLATLVFLAAATEGCKKATPIECNLPSNQLFDKIYRPNDIKPVSNLPSWRQQDLSTGQTRINNIVALLRSSRSPILIDLASYIEENPPAMMFVDGWADGQPMYTDLSDPNNPTIVIGSNELAYGDNIATAIIFAHEYTHLIGKNTDQSTQFKALCEEQRAYAIDALLTAHFPNYPSRMLRSLSINLEQLGWQWESKEWQDYILSLFKQ